MNRVLAVAIFISVGVPVLAGSVRYAQTNPCSEIGIRSGGDVYYEFCGPTVVIEP
ncbi:MAG: hypothetical protein WB815_00295 [Nitrososphaeraceae archaeon]